MNRFVEGIKNFLRPLSLPQRTLFAGLMISTVLVMGVLFWWTFKPDYTLLFGNLPPESAQEVIQVLEDQNIPYRLENGGRALYVPGEKVPELRLHLAAEGIGRSDVLGYELFDENALGMTDFMQQINRKRALEGELARSINSLDQVESSRVHLVLPERSPFRETSVQASASVIVKLARGKQLTPKQIEGMIALISGSVEGLDPSSVTVLDQLGNRLSSGAENSPEFASGSLQMQLQQQMETYLTDRGQSMLDRVLGPGNSILRVSVEHNFDRLIRESELVDPDSRTIVSEERRTETGNQETLDLVPIDEFTPLNQRGETVVTMNQGNESTVQVRNYDFTRTREVFERTQGQLSRVSASVLVNYKQTVRTGEQGGEIRVSEPWSPEELDEFAEVVRVALGMQPQRGDELTITQLEFYDPATWEPTPMPTPWSEVIRWILVAASFAAIVVLIAGIRRRMERGSTEVMVGFPGYDVSDVPVAVTESEEEEDPLDDIIDYKLTGQAQSRLIGQERSMLDAVKEYIDSHAPETAQVMRAIISLDRTRNGA